jgi:hypothetical protein
MSVSQPAGVQAGPAGFVGKRPKRRRQQLATTVHPETMDRVDEMCDHYNVSRGQLLDKLVLALWTCVKQGRLTCISGELCRFDRRDVPLVL